MVKKEYLIKKKDHLQLREKYLTNLKNKAGALRLRNERVKQCWRILRKYFRKQKLQSILRVEFLQNSSVIIALNQFQVEKAIINKNSKRFILAYISLLLKQSILQEIGLKGENKAAVDLIRSRVTISGTNTQEHSFLQLLHNLKVKQIDLYITITQ